MALLQSALGLLSFVALAWLFSENRSRVSGKVIVVGIGGQLLVGLIMLRLPFFQQAFMALNSIVLALEEATRAGTSLVFGYLGGGPLPFEAKAPGNLFILGFRALPLVLVVSALSSLFFYWRILPWVVRGFAWCLTKTLGIGGGGQCVRGHGGSTAVHPSLSSVDDPQRIVYPDDGRHGHHRRNSDGAVRRHPQ